MRIVGIDTSCDDTCVAFIENGKILKNIVSSQISLHKDWGGVVPDIAKRAHEQRIEAIFKKVVGRDTFDAIAVTQGPGLAPALHVGIDFATKMAEKYNKKLIAVNHIEGHILSPFVNQDIKSEFPILVLTASGGHSMLVLIQEIGKYKVLGETIDDAAGEALDKAAKVLGLGYPGGPIIERLSKSGDAKFLDLPLPLRNHPGYNFSFSGLKTSFYYRLMEKDEKYKVDNLENLAASFQGAVARHLMFQTEKAIKVFKPKAIFGVGGVMCNNSMRKELRKIAKKYELPVYFPCSKKLNTDNAAMIAYVGWLKAKRGEYADKIDREPRKTLHTTE